MPGYVIYIFLEKMIERQTGETLIRRCIQQYLIWVFTVCHLPFRGFQTTMGKNNTGWMANSVDLIRCGILQHLIWIYTVYSPLCPYSGLILQMKFFSYIPPEIKTIYMKSQKPIFRQKLRKIF